MSVTCDHTHPREWSKNLFEAFFGTKPYISHLQVPFGWDIISVLRGTCDVIPLPNCGSKCISTMVSTLFLFEVRFFHRTHLLLLLACPSRSLLCGKPAASGSLTRL